MRGGREWMLAKLPLQLGAIIPPTARAQAPASSSRTNPSLTFHGHLSNVSQDRTEAAKSEGICHLSGSGHPRTCEELWARA